MLGRREKKLALDRDQSGRTHAGLKAHSGQWCGKAVKGVNLFSAGQEVFPR